MSAPGEPLNGGAVLELWERAAGLDAPGRAVLLAACMGGGADEPLGTHHARLLRLHASAFGPGVGMTATCPGCGDEVEFELDATALAGQARALACDPVLTNGFHVTWRSPTPADLSSAACAPHPEDELLRRCVVAAVDGSGRDVSPPDLPSGVREAVSAAMAAADPLAEVLVELLCPACGSPFFAEVDVPGLVWAEVEAVARRVLLDVDELARAYGWTEADVLQLSDARRAAYLRIIRDGLP